MPTRIKNCGLKTLETVDHSIATGAKFLGFVHYPPSPRHLNLAEMRALVAHATPRAKTVAVLVAPENELLAAIAREVRPDYIQLHAVREGDRIAAIQEVFSIPIITAIAVREPSDLTTLATLEELSTHLLFDAPAPGGGKPFDWRLLKNLPLKKKWFLAGGLTAENVAQAIASTDAPMVDVSSGIEEPVGSGEKSLEKIAAFNAAVLERSS